MLWYARRDKSRYIDSRQAGLISAYEVTSDLSRYLGLGTRRKEKKREVISYGRHFSSHTFGECPTQATLDQVGSS
jgi:hypothetical protein